MKQQINADELSDLAEWVEVFEELIEQTKGDTYISSLNVRLRNHNGYSYGYLQLDDFLKFIVDYKED